MAKKQTYSSLKAWREDHDLSQREAARILGVSQAGWSKIELGIRRPRRDLAKRLLKKTGVPVEVLMGLAS